MFNCKLFIDVIMNCKLIVMFFLLVFGGRMQPALWDKFDFLLLWRSLTSFFVAGVSIKKLAGKMIQRINIQKVVDINDKLHSLTDQQENVEKQLKKAIEEDTKNHTIKTERLIKELKEKLKKIEEEKALLEQEKKKKLLEEQSNKKRQEEIRKVKECESHEALKKLTSDENIKLPGKVFEDQAVYIEKTYQYFPLLGSIATKFIDFFIKKDPSSVGNSKQEQLRDNDIINRGGNIDSIKENCEYRGGVGPYDDKNIFRSLYYKGRDDYNKYQEGCEDEQDRLNQAACEEILRNKPLSFSDKLKKLASVLLEGLKFPFSRNK